MNMRNEILKEHSRKQAEYIAQYALRSKENFDELFGYFTGDNVLLAQRASYALMVCTDERPGIILPYLGKLLKNLERKDLHDAVKRNSMRVLQYIDIPARYRGRVAEAAFGFLADKKEPVAIRVFAMTVISNLSRVYPELGRELVLMIENELIEGATAGFKSRAYKILRAAGKQ